MFIRCPKTPDDYRDRDLDCQEAIEHHFLEYARAGNRFIDLKKIEAAITESSAKAGWSNSEISVALKELARCYAMQVSPVRSGGSQRT